MQGIRRRRGGVEFGLIALACTLVAAAIFGSGLAQDDLDIPDSLTWLPNRDGHITRVDPDAGVPVDRMKVARPGDKLEVYQEGNVLTVVNQTTNDVTVIDLTVLSFAGTRRANPGVEVMLDRGRIFVADKKTGQVEMLDQLTAATVGEPLRLATQLTDATIDESGVLWLLAPAGQLVETKWSDANLRFAELSRRSVAGGEQAVLVSHRTGVTVLDPASDTVTQSGTGNDRNVPGAPLEGPLFAADSSPSGLVPVSAPDASKVIIVNDGKVSTVDSNERGCRRPGKPVVYRGLIYLACLGERKVIVLDPTGKPAGPAIPTPGRGDPEFVLNAGLLIVNVLDADDGLLIKPDGSVQTIRTRDPQVPVFDPANRPTALPTSMMSRGPRTTGPRSSGPGTPPVTPSPTRTPSPSPVPSPTQQADLTPTGVFAQARSDTTVMIAWTPPATRPASYRILRAGTSELLGAQDGMASSTILTGLPVGMAMAFVVEAVSSSGTPYRSLPSNTVFAFGRPPAPSITVASVPQRLPHLITVQVTIAPNGDGGSALTSWDLSIVDGRGVRAQSPPIPSTQDTFSLDIACADQADICLAGGGVTIRAAYSNAAGAGAVGSATTTIAPQRPFNYNDNANMLIVSAGLKCWTFGFVLQTCNPFDGGHVWRIMNTGPILTVVNGNCITPGSGGTLRYANDGCSERPRRYTLIGFGNEYRLQNQEGDIGRPCLYAAGDPAGDNTPIRLRTPCFGDANERWTFFAPFQPVVSLPLIAVSSASASAAAARSTSDGGLGMLAVILLVPLAAGWARRRSRHRE